jgi:putative ABC transport system ATP-binding protein
MEPIVSLESVGRRYPLDHSFVSALEDVTFDITPGEFLAVAGPSGSGKSTLLNLIGGLDRPTTGRVRIQGKDLTTLSPGALAGMRRTHIGFVFQSFNLIPVFSAAENVEYPLLLCGLHARERRERVAQALASVGLSARARQRPDLLSGGEKQRVAVARAIVHRPALVLADEPTANLDTKNASELILLMRGLNRNLGLTFLFSTHDPRLLGQADRVIHLVDGRIASDIRRETEPSPSATVAAVA